MHGFIAPLIVTAFGLISMVGSPAFAFTPSEIAEAEAAQVSTLDEARATLESGNEVSAMAQLVRYLGDDPGNPEAWLLLGQAYRSLGQMDDADAAYVRALELAPDHRGALLAQGELYLATGRTVAAEVNLSRLTALCGGIKNEAALLATALVEA